jgi:hypothetical protein
MYAFMACKVSTSLLLNDYRFHVELDSTALSAVPSPVSSSSRHVTLQCCILVFPKLLLSGGYYEIWKLDFFCKSHLNQTVSIHNDNLDSEGLNWLSCHFLYVEHHRLFCISQIQHVFPLRAGFNDVSFQHRHGWCSSAVFRIIVVCISVLWGVSLCNEPLLPGYTASYPTKEWSWRFALPEC